MRIPKFARLILLVLIVAGLVAGGVAVGWRTANHRSYTARHMYPLLDPSVGDPDIHQEIINFDPLRQDLKQYMKSLNLPHSLYFEYLPNGVSIRDGEDNISQAASLMKTPLIMDLYKLAEEGKINLDSQSVVEPVDINTDSQYGNPTHIKAGDSLTLRQAAQITLKHSDNTTLNVIKGRIIPLIGSTNDSFRSLDLSYAVTGPANQEQVSISARSYSSILKCLYYSCFNTPQDSTQILQYMINSAEPNRLAAGVGKEVKIAHKVGSGNIGAQSDCGIIYYPGKPYLVCLMFFNIKDPTDVDPYFKHVSKMIYDYIGAH